MNSPDDKQLQKLLDQARSEVFRNRNAAFLASILCSLNFKWLEDDDPKEVATDGETLFWKKRDFLRCDKEERKFTLIHEIWHPARLHFLRGAGRDPKIWNIACDLRINNDMIRDGYNLPNNGYWLFDPRIDSGGILSEEQIYDLLVKKAIPVPDSYADMLPPPADPNKRNQNMVQQVAMVVRAVQAAAAAGKPGSVPGGVVEALDKFLNPVVPWRDVLAQWMTDLTAEDYSWSRKNRRFPNTYMPSLEFRPDGLENLAFFIDTSASITDPAVRRFNSEVKYIWENLRPSKLTLVQFDTQIQDTRAFKEGDEFRDIRVHGRGGTSMVCVREWIEENRPTAAVVFSDMECVPMQQPSVLIPVLFAVIPGGYAQLPDFGKIIHITE